MSPLANLIATDVASLITWTFVTIVPLGSTKNPDPLASPFGPVVLISTTAGTDLLAISATEGGSGIVAGAELFCG
jgi:hypothetical protein